MSNFPLYNNLIKDIPKKDLTVKQKEEFVNKVGMINETGTNLVVALIQFFCVENAEEELLKDLPYKGTRETVVKRKENLSWSFSNFPIKLRHILYKFVLLHMHSMEEEKVRVDQIC